MDPRIRALTVDLGLAVGAAVAGSLSGGLDPSVWGLAYLAVAVCTMAAASYLAEQTALLDVVARARPLSLLVVGVVTFLLASGLLVGTVLLDRPIAVVLSGLGAGLLGYRLVYGLFYPLPNRRLRQAGGDGSSSRLDPP